MLHGLDNIEDNQCVDVFTLLCYFGEQVFSVGIGLPCHDAGDEMLIDSKPVGDVGPVLMVGHVCIGNHGAL